MKKLFSLIFILILGLLLTGCLPKKQEVKPQDRAAELSQDGYLEINDDEIDPELEEFEAELDELEEEINQL